MNSALRYFSLPFQIPKSEIEWKDEAQRFHDLWGFPNCLGAIDGKHVAINKPKNAGSFYFNYKKFHSIVIMAVVNANLEFSYVDVGMNGRISDGGIFGQCAFGQNFNAGRLHLPGPATLPGSATEAPFVFIADDAFPLKTNLLKPFSGFDQLTRQQDNYNYRLSRARMVVERAFGILANRFAIFKSNIRLSPVKASIVVLAACYLHNFLRRKNPSEINVESVSNGEAMTDLQDIESTPTQGAKGVRELFVHYFSAEGHEDF